MEHKEEKKICQNCKNDFTIEHDDFSFYEKIKTPPPTFCLDCRNQRKYAWRNERNLYRRNCDLCGKSTVTMYHPDSIHKVYCQKCWWSDGWDEKSFGIDFDFTRSFFEQFKELQLKVPRLALLNKNSINSDYTNHSGDNKNLFLSYECFDCENSLHLSQCWNKIKDSIDSNMCTDGGVMLYECVSSNSCYNCQYCLLIKNSIDCYYCFDCINCQNCFLSYNLRNKKYVFENQQLTKEEYSDKINKLKLDSFKTREILKSSWLKIIKEKAIHKYAQIISSVNVTGDVIANSKNCKNVYDAFDSEEVSNSIVVIGKEIMDAHNTGIGISELIYESHAITNSSNIKFSHLSYDNSFIEYCDSVHNSQNLFGCISLKKANYCILNKQYSKEEYIELKEKIIQHMKKTGEYGEFFPSSLSPFGYNETQGQVYMPITKEEALNNNFNWQDDIKIRKGEETIKTEDLLDSILDTKDDITKEVIRCISCDRNFNIVDQELGIYRRLNIPIPRRCPNCRYLERIALRPLRKLWHRSCMNKGCTNEFETSYAPDQSEIIYCEKCYQQEVY